MDFLVSAAVNVALFVLAILVWRWSRKQASVASTAWRRRVGLTFFFLPIISFVVETIAEKVGVPDAVLLPLRALTLVRDGINFLLAQLIGLTKEGGTLWSIALRPLCYAVVYGGVGVLVGWPLDRMAKKKAAAAAGPPPATTAGGMQIVGENEKNDGWSA